MFRVWCLLSLLCFVSLCRAVLCDLSQAHVGFVHGLSLQSLAVPLTSDVLENFCQWLQSEDEELSELLRAIICSKVSDNR